MPPLHGRSPVGVVEPPLISTFDTTRATASAVRVGRGPSDVGREPDVDGVRRPEELDHAILGRRLAKPRGDRPLLPGHEALVPEEVGARVILWIAPRDRLERVMSADFDFVALDAGDEPLELAARRGVSHGPAKPIQLIRRHHVHAAPGGETRGRQVDVSAVLERRGNGRLVWRLVGAEPNVTVRTEDLALAELRFQFS